MADIVSRKTRSRMMASVRQANTKPEVAVRKLIHKLGFRFRLHRRDLPGSPDIVLPRHRKVIFVHGCFWHRHGCRRTTTPATNFEFWQAKFEANEKRDRTACRRLKALGWEVLIVWECQTKRPEWLQAKVQRFLDSPCSTCITRKRE